MTTPDYKNVTVQMEQDLLVKADERAGKMDLNRSQYLRRLIRRDLGLLVPDVQPHQLTMKPGTAEVAA